MKIARLLVHFYYSLNGGKVGILNEQGLTLVDMIIPRVVYYFYFCYY